MKKDFHEQIIACLPKLRSHALALTKNKSSADDLVQDAVTNALAGQDSFIPGTNFMAWMHRILHNKFISDMRRKKETYDIDEVPESSLAVNHAQSSTLEIRELANALDKLPAEQRATLIMVFVNEMSYEQVAAATNCSLGTVKSRVFRARKTLSTMLLGDENKENIAKNSANKSSASSLWENRVD